MATGSLASTWKDIGGSVKKEPQGVAGWRIMEHFTKHDAINKCTFELTRQIYNYHDVINIPSIRAVLYSLQLDVSVIFLFPVFTQIA
jgi:hypothetical protein